MPEAADFKEGDWRCEMCGDHQFARNAACRKCGNPKPMVASNGQASKKGDWICPNPSCQDLQFERNPVCRKCGTPKPFGVPSRASGAGAPMYGAEVSGAVEAAPRNSSGGGFGGGEKKYAEDWTCSNCGDLQFGRNVACRQCGNPKPVVSSNGQAAKAGDWICPSCKDLQFEKNQQCRKCGEPRPFSMGKGMGMGGMGGGMGGGYSGYHGGGGGGYGSYGMMSDPMSAMAAAQGYYAMERFGSYGLTGGCKGFSGKGREKGAGGRPTSSNNQSFKPGDWICPNCGDVQFDKNSACRMCSTPKPDQPTMSSNMQSFKEGDWICPGCQDLQFARNSNCRKCGTPKPDGTEERERSPRRMHA